MFGLAVASYSFACTNFLLMHLNTLPTWLTRLVTVVAICVFMIVLWRPCFQTCVNGGERKKYLHTLCMHSHTLPSNTPHPLHTLARTVTSRDHHSNYWRATGGDYCDLSVFSLYSSNGAGHGDACWVDFLRALMDWRTTDVSGLCCSIL